MKRIWILSFFLLAAFVSIFVTACDELITEITEVTITGYPKANFLVASDSCCLPCTLQFFDDSDGPHHEWFWSFGDGDNSGLIDPSHGYANAGRYTITLVIRDTTNGNEDREIRINYINVKDTLHRSLATMSIIPTFGNVADTFSFDASLVGVAKTWLWNFGDGSTLTTPNLVTHTYASPGTYEVRLTLTNDCDSLDLVDSVVVN